MKCLSRRHEVHGVFVDGNTSVGPGIDASSVGGMQRRGQRDRAPTSLVFIDDPSAGFTDAAGTCHLNRRNFRLLRKIPGAFGRRKRRDVISGEFEHMDLPRRAVDLDQRSRRQRPGGPLSIHHAREPELARHHGGV